MATLWFRINIGTLLNISGCFYFLIIVRIAIRRAFSMTTPYNVMSQHVSADLITNVAVIIVYVTQRDHPVSELAIKMSLCQCEFWVYCVCDPTILVLSVIFTTNGKFDLEFLQHQSAFTDMHTVVRNSSQ